MVTSGNILLTRAELPPEQQAIHARCHHPSGAFTEFSAEELERSIPDRFERIVRKYPERIAVKTEDCAVTYAELNALANRVAHAILTEHGSEPQPVALLMDRGVALFAAMMGVLKSGNFFVPFNAGSPEIRIERGLLDLQARFLITDLKNAALAKKLTSEQRRVIEAESVQGSFSEDNPGIAIAPDAFAYVIYTSGSTGEPKGVIQNHRHLLNRVMLGTHAYHICPYDRLALLASGTGTAINNAFVPLLNGALLDSFAVEKHGVSRLVDWLARERISVCPISPPLFRNIIEALGTGTQLPDVRVLRVSSDAVYQADVDLFKRYFDSNCVLATGLSSTETGFITTFFIDHGTVSFEDCLLGYPVSGIEVLLLDDEGREVPPGDVGEIAVKSRYLSAGYWHQPELTKLKFLPDPARGEKRIYLSGDLAYRLPDGCLVYKGRKDFRAKVRGYGVEFAEVEKALLKHTSVREALVTTRQNSAGETELVAYVTSKEGSLTVSHLRAFLEEKLPGYMVPTVFAILDAMPIAANGKIDRRALPAVGRSRPNLATVCVPPQTAVQQTLAKIWTEVLEIDAIGIHDRFLELGGTSLSATRILSRVLKKYQLDLPVQSLFQSPTIAEMAGMIAEAEVKKVDGEDLTRILAEVESLSDAQAQGSLGEKAYQEPPATLTKKGRHE